MGKKSKLEEPQNEGRDKEEIKALELAKKQREISIAQFFTRNRHLLGFDNPSRALLMTVKELVDNSTDASDEMHVLGEVLVEIKKISDIRYTVIVEDNGPGIVKKQIPSVFGKLLYGSKFFSRRQSRGQQGLGVSMSVLYSQLTTGKPTKIISKIAPNKPAEYYELKINTEKNEPEIVKEETRDWKKDHGTRVEIELEAKYQKGRQSVDEYIKQTVIANPHISFTYINPDNEKVVYPRAVSQLPLEPKEIKPHPYGIELGILQSMLYTAQAKTLQSFLTSEFSRVGSGTAKEICLKANLQTNAKPAKISSEEAERLFKAMQEVKIIAPPTDCLSPISQEILEKGIKKEFDAEFYAVATRSPVVYRGFPFQIEAAIIYDSKLPQDEQVKLLRFANRVPLLYQQGACAVTEAVTETNWKPYGLQQSSNNLPVGPATIIVHMVSVWVPFTSEAKDAIAHYPEIIKEIKLALQECGRKLAVYIHKKHRSQIELEKRGYIEKYLPHIGEALREIIKLNENEEKKVLKNLKDILEKSRKEIEIEIRPKVKSGENENG